MADTFCPPVIDGRGKSSDDPCSLFWCGGTDYDAWKKQSQWNIAQALMRDDLPANVVSQLRQWNQQIETLPRSKVDSGAAVRMMTSIARQAECIALQPVAKLPPLVQVEKIEWYKRKEVWMLIAALLAGGYLVTKMGLLAAIGKRLRGKGKRKK